MQERRKVVLNSDAGDNENQIEPLTQVCAVNADKVMARHDETQLPKTNGRKLTKG